MLAFFNYKTKKKQKGTVCDEKFTVLDTGTLIPWTRKAIFGILGLILLLLKIYKNDEYPTHLINCAPTSGG